MKNNITNALLSLLNKGIVRFTYRKVDGTIREAVGTRNLDMARTALDIYIPNPVSGRNNPTAYYDLEKEDWRSFKAENVISINGIDIKSIKGVRGSRIVKVGEPIAVEIPINCDDSEVIPIGSANDIDFGGIGVGIGMGIGIGGGKPTDKGNEPKGFDLGKIKTALGMPNGTPIVKGEFGMGKPIGGSVAVPMGEGKGMVFTPLAVSKEHTTLPIDGMSIEDFAKLVAHYVIEELIGRIK